MKKVSVECRGEFFCWLTRVNVGVSGYRLFEGLGTPA